jgi:MFS family permease
MRELQSGGDAAAIGASGETVEVRPSGRAAGLRLNTFASLRHRDFRYLWIGVVFTSAAQWIQQVTLGWLVYDMTDSAILLGAIYGARAVPTLIISPLGGIITDRMDRRVLMLIVEPFLMALTLAIGILVATGLIEVWHLFVYTILSGAASNFNHTARQALIPNLIPKQDILNAIALNSMAINSSRILGPALGGYLIAWFGVSGNFFLQAAAFGGVLVMAYFMRVPPTPAHTKHSSMWENLRAGIRYVRQDRIVFGLVILALLPAALQQPSQTLMPIFAKDVLEIGPDGFGMLLAATGVGALIAPLILASGGNSAHKGVLMFGGLIGMGLSLVLFARSEWLALSLVILPFVGGTFVLYRSVNNTVLLTVVPDEMRGRVTSILGMDNGLAPLATLLAGMMASFMGAPLALTLLGSVVLALALLAAAKMPYIRALS